MNVFPRLSKTKISLTEAKSFTALWITLWVGNCKECKPPKNPQCNLKGGRLNYLAIPAAVLASTILTSRSFGLCQQSRAGSRRLGHFYNLPQLLRRLEPWRKNFGAVDSMAKITMTRRQNLHRRRAATCRKPRAIWLKLGHHKLSPTMKRITVFHWSTTVDLKLGSPKLKRHDQLQSACFQGCFESRLKTKNQTVNYIFSNEINHQTAQNSIVSQAERCQQNKQVEHEI